jgi:hypothetical protein
MNFSRSREKISGKKNASIFSKVGSKKAGETLKRKLAYVKPKF